VPESPRWLFIHGREKEAERIVEEIEREIREETGQELPPVPDRPIRVRQRKGIGFGNVARTLFQRYPRRTVLGFSLFIGQAFLYNSILFSYGPALTKYYGVSSGDVGLYLLPFAIGNLVGPLVLGVFFDTVGRKPMISFTYVASGVLLLITSFLFKDGSLTATTQVLAWSIVFFFASAGASSAYLTVSEIFPMETRAMAISFFYALGTAAGGITGPLLFGKWIPEDVDHAFYGYALGAVLMIAGGVVEIFLGVEAAGRSLEDIAKPLTAEEAEAGGGDDMIDAVAKGETRA
jgi:MFS family permease